MVLGGEHGVAEALGRADLGGAGGQGKPVTAGVGEVPVGSVELQLGCRHEPQCRSDRGWRADEQMDNG